MSIAPTNAPTIQNSISRAATTSNLSGSILGVIQCISEWRRRILYRRELERLLKTGPHLIQDMGLGIDEALHEVSKPFYVEWAGSKKIRHISRGRSWPKIASCQGFTSVSFGESWRWNAMNQRRFTTHSDTRRQRLVIGWVRLRRLVCFIF